MRIEGNQAYLVNQGALIGFDAASGEQLFIEDPRQVIWPFPRADDIYDYGGKKYRVERILPDSTDEIYKIAVTEVPPA
jgi:hypothetical protein